MIRNVIAALLLLVSAPLSAQLSVDVTDESGSDLNIAVPAMPTPQSASTPAGTTEVLGRQIAEVIAANLRGTGLFKPAGPAGIRAIAMGEVTSPQYEGWAAMGASALVQGFVRVSGPEELTVGCYLYDTALKTEMVRLGFAIAPRDWRRAAHKCADAIYSRLSGEKPFFDSQIRLYRRKRAQKCADQAAGDHGFGWGQSPFPDQWPDDRADSAVFRPITNRSFIFPISTTAPRIFVYDIASARQRLVTESANPTFAPRWSPNGRTILYSMAVGGNTDIYSIPVTGGTPRRLTNTPGIDIGGSFSPDGSKIVFESDRSGSQQLYVMNADGSGQQRISFGGGRFATPEWSPRGDLIAFTKIAGNFPHRGDEPGWRWRTVADQQLAG